VAKTLTNIRALARSHSAKAVRTLAGIMNEDRAPAAARVSAAIALLDRGWGKSKRAVEMDWRGEPMNEMTDEELMAIAAGGTD
jgi:hypothetical protein